MSRTVTYYFSLNSPWSYLGGDRLAAIARRRGATVDVRPVDVMRLFRESGSQPLSQRPKARQDYRLWEIKRWGRRLDIPVLPYPDAFPCDERLAAACVLVVKAGGGDALRLATALGGALWVDNRDLSAHEVVADVLTADGFEAGAALAEAEGRADHWETERQANTDAALAAGAFGVPTYVVGEEPFWGQDRLDFVEEALA
ncbi:2-hydroxychromene-2-carboxylate isomerase [Rhodospira trueperi]|uniref:2-hydroxychromene-2-carboxylate isomerase n=1 Tax=Rhodospira trueperi TaxID=69960 RepID=A0A1G6XLD5_9PROT|nr:2-hydroxychromene-2-carboxylate isomerase [Rhodospira trueperi]SDD78245.1 2-hydroxychromene-2-carboxylate isomerase [Rhodospira trueperi]